MQKEEMILKMIEMLLQNENNSSKSVKNLGEQIVVLHRGWVIAGDVTIDGDIVYAKDSRCIRRWGRPLGELATVGPNKDTVLEQPCQEQFPLLGVIEMIKIESDLLK